MKHHLFKQLVFLILLFVSSTNVQGGSSFDQDRAAILGMAGAFEVDFRFTETVSLRGDYELKKPYRSKALELVKVVEDLGSSITLQHLLIIEDIDGPTVIKHWAQIWNYEDTHTLTFEGRRTWLPVHQQEEETKGTWTQFVTQVDDSPRYKAKGIWEHTSNYSAWTSELSTRPLPRREYSKRSDYDRLQVVNTHVITTEGWVHLQENRKEVRREGQNYFLCLETGRNTYKRITPELESDQAAGIVMAEEYWEGTHLFWKDVRALWASVLTESEKPVHYTSKAEPKGKGLMFRMGSLAEESKEVPVSISVIASLLEEHLR